MQIEDLVQILSGKEIEGLNAQVQSLCDHAVKELARREKNIDEKPVTDISDSTAFQIINGI